jgi:cytochrome c553
MMNAANKPRSRGKGMLVMSGWLLLAAAGVAGVAYGPDLVGLYRLGQEIETIAQEDKLAGGAWPRNSDACMYCHGFGGNARSQVYPRLAGQQEGYLRKQLQAFASGERGDPVMTPMALSMSEREMESLVSHFSKMKPVPNATFNADRARVARGEALARAGNCAGCHGQQLEGKGEFPRLAGQGYDYLRDQLAHFKSGARRDATGAMQAVASQLAQPDIEDLAQYVASR